MGPERLFATRQGPGRLKADALTDLKRLQIRIPMVVDNIVIYSRLRRYTAILGRLDTSDRV